MKTLRDAINKNKSEENKAFDEMVIDELLQIVFTFLDAEHRDISLHHERLPIFLERFAQLCERPGEFEALSECHLRGPIPYCLVGHFPDERFDVVDIYPDEATRPQAATQMIEGFSGVPGMMQHASRINDVEEVISERQGEDIGLSYDNVLILSRVLVCRFNGQ